MKSFLFLFLLFIASSAIAQRGTVSLNTLLESDMYNSFAESNAEIVAQMDLQKAEIGQVYNQLLDSTLTTLTIPLMEGEIMTGAIIAISSQENFLIFYQKNIDVRKNANGETFGTFAFELFNSSSSYFIEINDDKKIIQEELKDASEYLRPGRWGSQCCIVTPTWECIDAVRDKFSDRCTGFCRFLCEVSNLFAGSCIGGTYLGAATWCARNFNHGENY